MADYRNAAPSGLQQLLQGLQPLNDLGDAKIKQQGQAQEIAQKGQLDSQLSSQNAQQNQANESYKAYLASQLQADNIAKIKELMASRKPGEKTSYDLEANGGVKTTEQQPNMMMLMNSHLGQEGKAIEGLASKAYKPIQDQAEAAEMTLNSLAQGNSAADKAAIINESNMFLKGGGGRAMGAVMAQLTGQQTAQGALQQAANWVNNTSNIPTLQPAQRNALREAVLGRVDQLKQQHQQISNTLPVQAKSVAPFTAASGGLNDIVQSYGMGATNSLGRLDKMKADYTQQQQAAQAPVSSPATFNQQPSTLDKLKGFFHMGSKPQEQQAPVANQNSPLAPNSQPGASIRVKHKASGQTGTIPSNEFDPSQYDRIQ